MTTSVWGVDHGEVAKYVDAAVRPSDISYLGRPSEFNTRRQNTKRGAVVGGLLGTAALPVVGTAAGAGVGAVVGSRARHKSSPGSDKLRGITMSRYDQYNAGAKKINRAEAKYKDGDMTRNAYKSEKKKYREGEKANRKNYRADRKATKVGKNYEGDTMSTISVWGVDHGTELVSKAGTGLAIGAGQKLASRGIKLRSVGRKAASHVTNRASNVASNASRAGAGAARNASRVSTQTQSAVRGAGQSARAAAAPAVRRASGAAGDASYRARRGFVRGRGGQPVSEGSSPVFRASAGLGRGFQAGVNNRAAIGAGGAGLGVGAAGGFAGSRKRNS